jgi:2-polyprenyl-6-hydroxyphenyl methylase/3-demethylubiquinone-9 3-methyltransferase
VTPEEIRAGAPSLQWQEPVGVSYSPLGRGWTLSRDISMNYMMAGVRPT